MKHMPDELYDELSDIMLSRCRELDEALYPKGGWNGWTTSGMRMMTDTILHEIYERIQKYHEKTTTHI